MSAGGRYAVIGGGFAGVAVAWHLLNSSSSSVSAVDLFDAAGLGGGASGAAAGLLHPFSPKGKLLWRGEEAMEAALRLLKSAERHADQQRISWAQPLLRPGGAAAAMSENEGFSIRPVSAEEAGAAVPGLCTTTPGLWIEGGHVVHPRRYLHALWRSCVELGRAALLGRRVACLAELSDYTAIIVAAGAAAGTLPEVADRLPLELCQGYTLDLTDEQGCYGGPSLLGPTYIAAQGGQHLVVGATKRFGLDSARAMAECGRGVSDAESAGAASELQRRAAAVWEPAGRWQVAGVRSGVRALPPRTAQGALPLAGRLRRDEPWWIVSGLGARGLVYHALLGEMVSAAVLADDESLLPAELRRWQR